MGFGPSHSFSGSSSLTSCPETFPASALHEEQPFGPVLMLRREIFITSSRMCSHKAASQLACSMDEPTGNGWQMQCHVTGSPAGALVVV